MTDTNTPLRRPRFSDWRARGAHVPSAAGSAASAAQRRLWLLDQIQGGQSRYNCPHALRALGPLPAGALEQAFATLCRRHEALRSSFFTDESGTPLRRVADPFVPTLGLIDLAGVEDPPAVGLRLLRMLLARPFDLGRAPLWRAGVVRLADDDHLVYLSAHHAIVDDWSMGILLRELRTLLDAAIAGRPASLGRVAHHAPSVDHTREAAALAYWKQQLAGVPVLLLPTDRPRGAHPGRRGAKTFARLAAPLTAALDRQAHAQGVTAFSACLAAWRSVLSTSARLDDFAIGVPAFDRAGGGESQVGFAVNTLALRPQVEGMRGFWQAAAREFDTLLAGLEHREAQFDAVIEAAMPARTPGTDPLIQVMYTHSERADANFDAGGCRFAAMDVALPHARFELTLMTVRVGDELSASLEYDADLFEAASADALLGDFVALLEAAASDPQARRRPPVRRPALLQSPWPPIQAPESLAGRLRRRFAQSPDAVAMHGAGHTCSFSRLGARAEGVAQALQRVGVGPEDVVVVAIRRGPGQVAAMCGTILSGAAFAMIDPDLPTLRLNQLIESLRPAFVLFSCDGPAQALPPGLRAAELESLPDGAVHATPRSFDVPLDGLAYVVATSGTTGRSKLIGATHRGLLNRLDWMADVEPWGADERAVSRTQTMFVDFICEVLGPLCAGVPVVMASADQLADGHALVALLREREVTRLVATPSVLRELALVDSARGGSGLGMLRTVVSSGEAIAAEDGRALRTLAPGARLWNLYGSSEVAADATGAVIDDDAAPPSLGEPIAGMAAWLVDREGELISRGALGELQIQGPGVARGYLGDSGGTATVFRPSPLGPAGARAFATGDHGRLDPKGRLVFNGRKAGRVELRGLRVEIHEMEMLLRADPAVAEAAVVVAEAPRRTVARVVARGSDLEPHALRRRLLARAPAYLVPDQVEIGPLPRTPSGKVDYVLLAQERREHVGDGPPATPTEQALAQAWSEVLGQPVSDRADDFFALGGHSLAAARIARLLEQRLQRHVPIALLIVSPVLRDAAAALDDHPGTGPRAIATNPAQRFDPFDLHPLQAAYVAGRDTAFAGGGVSIHGYTEIRVPGHAIEDFERALNILIRRHDMLRAVLRDDSRQQVLAEVPPYRISRLDLRGLPPSQVEAHRLRMRAELSAQVLDLRRWPCFDIRASLVDGEPPCLHVSFDAIFVDAWSQSLLLQELVAVMKGDDVGWQPPRLGFRDYLVALQARRGSPEHERAWADWLTRLPTLPEAPPLPRPESSAPPGPPRIVQLGCAIPPDVVRRLAERSGSQRLTHVLVAAFALVIGRWSGSSRILLNIPVSGRGLPHEDIERVVGPFGDFTYVAFDLEAHACFDDVVRAARQELNWALERNVVCGMELARELMALRGFRLLTPFVFTSLNFEGGARVASAETMFEEIFSASQTPQVHLDNRVRLQSDGSVRICWDVTIDQFPAGVAEEMLAAYRDLVVRASESAWDSPLAAWSVDPPAPTAEPAHGRLDTAFWIQARQAPDELAVAFPDGQWSYAELAGRAAAVARDLRALGIARGDIVVVALDKGPAQIAAVLGVLRCGAAYAPLDPLHPAQHLAELVDSLEACCAIVEPRDLEACWLGTCRALPILMSAPAPLVDSGLPEPVGQPGDLAYVIHTSGSTGRPKGVMIAHAAAQATIAAVNRRLDLSPVDRVLSISALGFDLSVWDIFGPLAVGAAVVVPTATQAKDPAAWLRLAHERGVTIWNSAPALMSAALERRGPAPLALRWAMLSGDFIPLTTPVALREAAPGCRLLSLGGATEAAIWSVWFEVDHIEPGWRSIPYGTALPGQQAWVVDASLHRCPPWVEGEIVIGGCGLALGYWRNPNETATRFVVHPRSGQRLYRTGDRGRLRAGGEIEILGRIDRQLKINGHRIEPGEVEAVLQESGLLSRCVVLPHLELTGARQLVAHVVRRPDDSRNAEQMPAPAELGHVNSISRMLPDAVRQDLGVSTKDLIAHAAERRSRRAFLPQAVRRRALGRLLANLARIEHPRSPLPRRLYGSAGHLYPVETYVAVRPGAVAGIEAGYYYVDPADVSLLRTGQFDAEDEALVAGGNAALFASSAFAIVLAADLSWLRQKYPRDAERFAAIEAGLISQLLETAAPHDGLGLCQVGGVDAALAARRCRLGVDHIVLHALVGGPVDGDPQADLLVDVHGWQRIAARTSAWLQDRRCEDSLRRHAVERLPLPLRPVRFVFWSKLPLTSNGKVNHAALDAAAGPPSEPAAPPSPAREAMVATLAVVQPADDTSQAGRAEEVRLLELWRTTLANDIAGPEDSFFVLGGNSLQALRLLARVEEEFGRAPSVADFLDQPTVSGLHALLRRMPVSGNVPRTAVRQPGGRDSDPFPLNPLQQAYVVSRAGVVPGFTRAARNYFEVDFEGLDLARLERAVQRLIDRHGMLRARFEPPVQYVPDDSPVFSLPVEELADLDEHAATLRLAAIRKMMEERVAELSQSPLFDLFAARLPGGVVRLHFGLDLMICDARSFQILHEDLMCLYESDADDTLAPLAITFREHAIAVEALRAGPRGEIDRQYWSKRVANLAPPVRLPTLDAGSAAQFGMFRRLTARMEKARFDHLRALAAAHGVTASGVLCAAFSRVLSVWNGAAPFTINLTTFGREPLHRDVDLLVGEFTSSTLLEIDPRAPDFVALAQDTQRSILSDLEHRSFTGTEVLRLLNKQRGRIGDFEASVVFTSLVGVTLGTAPMAPGLTARLVHACSQTPHVLLDHQVFDIEGHLVFNWDFAADRFPEGTVEQIFETYTDFLNRLVDDENIWRWPT